MRCPFCKGPDTQVIDTRESEEGDSIRAAANEASDIAKMSIKANTVFFISFTFGVS